MAVIVTDEDHAAYVSTMEHKKAVEKLMTELATLITKRGKEHDNSKLEDPEFPLFSKYTAKLAGLTYGSNEYQQCLAELQPALKHHYANNRHHAEHYQNGIQDMTIVDIIEMFVDWYCASKRHADGNIRKSLEINKERFGMSEELTNILVNSIELVDR